MTRYALRASCFGYNDENFYVCGSRIEKLFNEREKAEAAYRKAQLKYLRDIDLGEHEKFFNGDDDYVRKMAEFIKAKTGESILSDGGWVEMDTKAHTNMSDDDLFEFGEKGGVTAFKLIEFEDDAPFVALFNTRTEAYCKTVDEAFEGLIYGASRDELLGSIGDYALEVEWEDIELQGSLEALSETPAVLRNLINSVDEFEYDEDEGVLRLGYPETAHIVSLNALLREPLFEFRELSLDEILDIEKDLDGGTGDFSDEVLSGCGGSLLKAFGVFFVAVLVFAAADCYFSSCDSFVDAFGDVAWTLAKWLGITALAIVSLVVIAGALFLFRVFRPKRKKK